MVSTFGPNVRGVSPYSDYLFEAISQLKDIGLRRVDFESIYPSLFYPASGLQNAANDFARLHYARPISWNFPIEMRPDILHLQYWTAVTAPMYRGIVKRARRRSLKTILTVHNASPHETIAPLRPIERRLLSDVDHLIVHTDGGVETIVSTGIKHRDQITVIPHGAPVNEVADCTATREGDHVVAGLNPNRRYVMFFGNIRHYKGVDLLLQAWSQIAAEYPNVDLIVAGRVWEGKNVLSKLASRILGAHSTGRNIKRMALRGEPDQTIYRLQFVKNETLFAICRIAELAVFPYRKFDAQSGAATLVGSHGVPLIVSSQGGLASLAIDDSYICDPLNVKTLAERISFHLNHSKTDARTRQRRRLEKIDWSQIALLHRELYCKLAGRPLSVG
jgi:glycosyltransferase involved in cell wall biosynthesis